MDLLNEIIYEYIKVTQEVELEDIYENYSEYTHEEVDNALYSLDIEGKINVVKRNGKKIYFVSDDESGGIVQKAVRASKYLISDEDNNNSNTERVSFKISELNISNKKKKIFSNEKYSFLVPENFKIREEEGRDFVAYLMNPNAIDRDDWEVNEAIEIYSSMETDFITKDPYAFPEVHLLGYDYNYWASNYYKFQQMYGELKYFKVKLENCDARVTYTKSITLKSFYVMVCIKGHYKQFCVQFSDVDASVEELLELVIELMNGFKAEGELSLLKEINDESFIVDDKVKVTEWITNLEKNGVMLKFCANYSLDIEGKRREALLPNYKDDFFEIAEGLLDDYIEAIDEKLKQIEEFVSNIEKCNISKNNLDSIYNSIKKFIQDNMHHRFIINDDEIIKRSELAKNIYEKLFDSVFIESEFEDDDEQEETIVNEKVLAECEDFISNMLYKNECLTSELETSVGVVTDMLTKGEIDELTFKVGMKNIREIVDSYGDSFVELIGDIDREARKLIDNGVNSLFIKQVLDLLKKVEDNTKIKLTFNNEKNYDRVVIEYDVPFSVDRIISSWEARYDATPERAVALKNKKEKEEQEKKKKEKVRFSLNEELDNLDDKDFEKLYEEIEELEKIIDDKVKLTERTEDKKYSKEIKKLEQESDSKINEWNEYLKKLNKIKKDKTEELEQLGVFNIFKKADLNTSLQNICECIESIKVEKNDEKVNLKNACDSLSNKHERRKASLIKEVKEKYLIPCDPKEAVSEFKCALERCKHSNVVYKYSFDEENTVYLDLLCVGHPVTILEFQKNEYNSSNYSYSELQKIFSVLIMKGKVIEVKDGSRTYYSALFDDAISNLKLNDSYVRTSFISDRDRVFSCIKSCLFESIPSITQLKNSYLLDDMSLIRLLQVLKSLEDSGRVKSHIFNNEICYTVVAGR